jgi:hypothetical protein
MTPHDLAVLMAGAIVGAIGGAACAILATALADRRRVRVADRVAIVRDFHVGDLIGEVPNLPNVPFTGSGVRPPPIRDLNSERERNIARAVRTGIPCRPIVGGKHTGAECEACGRGPCLGVSRVTR